MEPEATLAASRAILEVALSFMYSLAHLTIHAVGFFILGWFGLAGLLFSYWALRISEHWVTVLTGALIIVLSIGVTALFVLSPSVRQSGPSNALGGLSFLIAMFALGQWLARRTFLAVKDAGVPFVKQHVRNALHIPGAKMARFVSGFVVWGLLAVLVALGFWLGRRRVAKRLRLVHVSTALVFFLAFFIHAA